MKKWQIAISILLVFAVGTTVGAYGSRVIFKNRITRALRTEGSPGVKVIQGMMERLDLSEAQRASINDIIDKNNEKWETIRQEYEPKIKELYETVIEETKKELTDEQREEIESMSAKVQRRLPRRNVTPPRASTPPEGSVPPSVTQPFGQKPDPERLANIMDRLQVEKGKSAAVQSIIEADLQYQLAFRDELEKSQAAVEKKYQKKIADIKAATEKKLEKYLTPDQMGIYSRMMTPEEPRPEEFGFDTPGAAMEPMDFNQEGILTPPEAQPETPRDARSI
jgi:hypothetical protein